jgi:putative nucleotidyltransferase with HDIG domain
LFPKEAVFRYEFQKGKPWRHETLIAPFDFPILKSKDALESEKDSLTKDYIPYLLLDSDVEQMQLTKLDSDLSNAFRNYGALVDSLDRDSMMLQISSLYQKVYGRGILANSLDYYEVLRDKERLNIVVNSIAHQVDGQDVLSLKSAYLMVNDELKKVAQKDTFLLRIQKYIDLSDYLVANLTYDNDFNDQQLNERIKTLSTTRGVVPAGVRVISEGDLVNGDNFMALESLKQAYERKRSYDGRISTIVIGQMLLIFILFAVLFLYLQNFNRKIFWKKRNFSLIMTTVLASFVLARLIYDNSYINLYLLPVCILPIIIRTFLGARMAIFIHVITMMIIGFLAPNSFEFIFIQTVAGTVAVISLNKLHRRGHLVITALLLVVVYSVTYFSFDLIKEGNIQNVDWSEYKWFALNGLFILAVYPLIYVFEKIFGFISDVTLLELSDTNNPLLRKLAETAPGTFQHSMQVANLAEEAIIKIGGNPMLVRAGALYHDVGKITSSQYFIENQSVGNNPHDQLSKIKSAEKIISHVHQGVVLAKKYNIPDSIIDFIKMHHGRSMAKYFYLKYKEENPGKTVLEEQFMYPGPNPNTRETAVVMLADGIEAASRSLPEKNEDSLKAIINQIIDGKVKSQELDDAPLTFKDIKDIKAIFLEKLKNIYHLRIQYPKEE